MLSSVDIPLTTAAEEDNIFSPEVLAGFKHEAKIKQALSAQFESKLLFGACDSLPEEGEPGTMASRLDIPNSIIEDDFKGQVDQAVSFCMLKQPNIPIKRLPDSLEDTTSLIDSRGDYPLQSVLSSSRSRFSLLSASKLNDKLGSM